jgi:hypothetical protein
VSEVTITITAGMRVKLMHAETLTIELPKRSETLAVPEGWKLVPVVLTASMNDVFMAGYFTCQEMWDDLLAAAPIPEGGAV